MCVFLGTMRDINSGDEIKSMELQHYPEMTEPYLEKLQMMLQKNLKSLIGVILPIE